MNGSVASAVLWCMLTIGCAAGAPPARFSSQVRWQPGARLALVGDLQRTSGWEFWRERNDAERSLVVRHLAEGEPALLVFLGDLVWDGSSRTQWREFDELLQPVRSRSIPAVAVAGNHDYLWGGRRNLSELFSRFGLMQQSSFGWMRVGPLGLVLLDSNRRALGEVRWEEQRKWLSVVLSSLDAQPEVRGVIVVQHHPPYTNSTVTGDEEDVQQAFLPAFLGARKTLAMVAGHVHAYERFAVGRKQLFVSGGGGGPRARLLQGSRQRHQDQYRGPALRHFNVVWMTPSESGVEVLVMGIDKGQTQFHALERVQLDYP